MKRIYTIGLLLLISVNGLLAQKPVYISEDSLKTGKNILPALSVFIPEVNYETTLKKWIRLLESGTKSMVIAENEEMSIFGAILKDITNNPVNVYSRLMDQDTLLKLTASIELKKDLFVEKTTGETELAKTKAFLFKFAKEQYIELATEQLKLEENKLRDIERELGSLEKDETGMERSIRTAQKTIDTEKERLTVLRDELNAVSEVIADNTRILSSMKPGTEKDEKALFLKDLELKKKRTARSIAASENKISKAEETIEKAKHNIPEISDDQADTQDRIAVQESVVQRYTDKLNIIKEYR